MNPHCRNATSRLTVPRAQPELKEQGMALRDSQIVDRSIVAELQHAHEPPLASWETIIQGDTEFEPDIRRFSALPFRIALKF